MYSQWELNEDLLTAIQKREMQRVEELIKLGADVNYATMDGNTPLTFAIYGNDMGIIRFLLEKGADPMKKNRGVGGTEINAIYFARYIARNETIANFLEWY